MILRYLSSNEYPPMPSFPLRRESVSTDMVSRLSGNDKSCFVFALLIALFSTLFTTNSIAQNAINTAVTEENTAENPWIIVGGLARHSCRTCNFRESNPGIAVQWKSPWFEELTGLQNTRLTAGGYINSNNRNSVYAGAQWLPWSYGPVKLGLQGVIITGYLKQSVTPTLLPVLAVETRHIGVDLFAVPKLADVSAAAFLTFKVRF
jgi:hypothetical protein